MNKIEGLITELCPEGVEYIPIGDFGELVRGNGIQKSDFIESGFGCIHYGQIHTHFSVYATETKTFIKSELAVRLRKANKGDLVIATTSEDDEGVAKALAWIGEESVAVSTDAYILRHPFNSKYLSYFFETEFFQKQKKPFITGTKVRRISGRNLARIKIPIPPLRVQHEIVNILDTFSALVAELEAEMEARKKQYQYYRDRLLSFNTDSATGISRIDQLIAEHCPEGVEFKALKDMALVSRGKRLTCISITYFAMTFI